MAKLTTEGTTSALSNIFQLKRSIDFLRPFIIKRDKFERSLLRQGFHIPPEFHAQVYGWTSI